MDTTAEIHIPLWVSVSWREGRTWDSILFSFAHSSGAVSLCWGIPDDGLCFPGSVSIHSNVGTDGTEKSGEEEAQ